MSRDITRKEITEFYREFHEKIGKDKSLRVIINEKDFEEIDWWTSNTYIGELRPEIWEEIKKNNA